MSSGPGSASEPSNTASSALKVQSARESAALAALTSAALDAGQSITKLKHYLEGEALPRSEQLGEDVRRVQALYEEVCSLEVDEQ